MTRLTAVASCLLAGCLLGGSPRAPLEVRYFSPETAARTAHPRAAHPRGVACLQLGQITASSHLRYRIVHQTSEVERRLSDTLHWTETPDVYVRRSLARALFDDQPLGRAADGSTPVLDVEVLAFDDVARAGGHVGRVELAYELRDRDRVIATGEVAEERPAAAGDIEPVVRAIGAAMDAAVAAVVARTSSTPCPPDVMPR